MVLSTMVCRDTSHTPYGYLPMGGEVPICPIWGIPDIRDHLIIRTYTEESTVYARARAYQYQYSVHGILSIGDEVEG